MYIKLDSPDSDKSFTTILVKEIIIKYTRGVENT